MKTVKALISFQGAYTTEDETTKKNFTVGSIYEIDDVFADQYIASGLMADVNEIELDPSQPLVFTTYDL